MYNNYTQKLYLFEFDDEEFKIYELDIEFNLIAMARFDYIYTSDGSIYTCSFFSDGMMVCNVIHKLIDTNTWTQVGYAPQSAYVINDKLYEFSNGFIEIDEQGAIIKEYKFTDIEVSSALNGGAHEMIYVDGEYAYFIGTENNKEYVFCFDGESYEIVVCLNDYKYYTPFKYDFLCVSNDAVFCYDPNMSVIKEFKRN